MGDEPIHFYVEEGIDQNTLNGHIQHYLDRGATVCVHFHNDHQECSEDCDTRTPEVVHRNVFKQA